LTGSTSPGATEGLRGRLLYRGAEADVLLGRWQGIEAVFKTRKPLTYRLRALDDTIRRQRTIREAEMIHLAKDAGVSAPFMFAVDVPGATLVMEYIRGERLKDLLPSCGEKGAKDVFRSFGASAARLHRSGVMHGDLTTANVVVRSEGLVFIDFGLAIRSTRVEDRAVDIRLIKETLTGAHPGLAAAALDALYEGYAMEAGPAMAKSVMRQLRSIERRGRYARVT
jgi:TP53 regulating kinase and related kinases